MSDVPFETCICYLDDEGRWVPLVEIQAVQSASSFGSLPVLSESSIWEEFCRQMIESMPVKAVIGLKS